MIHKASLTAALAEKRSDRRIEVLRRIQESGSISEAARQVGISYKAAWQALDTLSNLAGVELVHRSVGGKGGGGAVLTPDALLLLEAADAMVHARAQLQVQLQQAQSQSKAKAHNSHTDAPRAGISVATTLARLQVVTSMRNQWPCVVESVSANGPLVVVHMHGAEAGAQQFVVRSHITGESAQLLGLKPGLPVLAMCKATAVTVLAADTPERPSANHWQGAVVRATRGGAVQELAVRLAAGVQLVGFSREATSLRARAKVRVEVGPSAVVIALSGE